jgi:2-polyprenyl-6-methoxyphenol hydroxylase-like FAD-dependent oxidoreductase
MGEQVLVAGAGPVGMTMAAALKRLGVSVRIVDPAPARTDKSKALVVWPRTLELLDIHGTVRGYLDAGLRGTGARIFANGRELVHLSFDAARSTYRFTLFLPQNETERLLEEDLAQRGVAVERRVGLQSFTDDGAGITATLSHPDGRSETARFAYLVGCDGAHSAARHGLASEFEGVTEPSNFVLADLFIDGDLSPQELTVCWQPDGIMAFFPIVGGRFRVIADLGTAPGETSPEPTLAEVQALVDARGPKGLRVRDPVWLSRFHINERKVKDYRKGRVFLAGDAAHIHSPAGGQGMNTGMQDAFNLAWKLALVCQGRARDSLLDSYSPERSAIGDQVLRNASQMTHVAIMRNPILQELRNLAAGALGHIPALRQRMVDQLTELDLHYEGGPLTGSAHGASRLPTNGHRAADIAVTQPGAMRLYEALRGGVFVAVSVGGAAMVVPPELTGVVTAVQAAEAPGYTAGYCYLVRPDGYVALSCRADDPAAIVAYLRGIAAG